MVDIHAHLYWKSYDADRDEVVKRAREAGVSRMISVGATAEESRFALEVAQKYDLGASVGIHPHEFNEGGSAAKDRELRFLDKLRELARDPKVIAIGECGLDYFSHDPKKSISHDEKARQKKGFEAQIHLAAELRLPLIVHCRPARRSYAHSVAGGDAYEDMLEILTNHLPPTTDNEESFSQEELKPLVVGRGLSVILHCYMGDTEVTRKFLELPNLFFSFTGNITYPVKKPLIGTRDDLTETVKLIPLERLFTETDCPFLSPQPKRGGRNEPAYVRYVLEKVAAIKREDIKKVESMIEENYQRVFNAQL